MIQLAFADKTVTYETFINDVAVRVVTLIKSSSSDPEYVSQAKAYSMFGRANVDRWRRAGLIEPRKRPGKLEYPTTVLRKLQNKVQDYL